MVLTQHIQDRKEVTPPITVSIPLWFSRNRFYYKDIIQVLGRRNQMKGKLWQELFFQYFGDLSGFDSRNRDCFPCEELARIF